jgi:REP element-mobilizing transposase RayT
MVYNPDIHHRRSIRLVGYNYSRSGAYFITICTHHRECIFGEIVNRAINYNELGNIARSLRDDKSFTLAEFNNTSSEYRNRRIVRGAYRR